MKTETQASPVQRHLQRHSGPYFLTGFLLLVLLYVLYRNYQLNQQVEHEKKTLIQQVQDNQLANDRQQLLFAMKTFGWAVRNAMLQNKQGEINEYFNALVQKQGVREILLVDPAGKVTLSTNKKNQGAVFADRYPAELLQQEEVYFANNTSYQLSAPINAPNQRLGTLVVVYAPKPVLLDSTAAN